ncbi:hypothetical protein AB0G64_09910 [Streptomyces longwoodensis]|uniref:hypothetical protein n=1 Tax=Streptomyces longwoodensis TaxID=68231 RepID=UPI0033E80917
MALLAALVPVVMFAVVLALSRYEDALLPTPDTERERGGVTRPPTKKGPKPAA